MSESGVAERLEQVEALAIEVFGSRATALAWLASPNFSGIRIFWLIGSYHDDGTNHQLSGLPG